MSAKRAFWLGAVGGAVVVLAGVVPGAMGWMPDAMTEMKELHAKLGAPEHVVTAKEAEAAQARLRQWNIAPDRLSEANRVVLWATEAYVALALGDTRTAADKVAALQPLAPEAPETWELAYLVSVAQGDAEAGAAALKKLGALVSGEQRRVISQRRRWLRKMGGPAPEVEIVAEDGTRIGVNERHGIVLVVDFWNTYDTTEAYAAALCGLREEMASVLCVQFAGVNADGAQRKAEALAFARKAGYTWPQCYEEKSTRPPITFGAFGAGTPPWTVVIDGQGRVRAVGSAAHADLVYAVRAAAREASEKLSVGRKSEPKPAVTAGEAGPRVGKGDLPSNDEAEALLRQARTYLRTGLKTKAKELLERIVRDYPGTRQAREAQERLEGWH